jgi:nicotinate-nucleotide adenylyltransferase
MRIGIFGGTFDPPHYGHLILAEQAREQAALDQVWFLLSARPPHKSDRQITPFERRAEMLALALAGHEDRFRVETIERDRAGLSYTADTLDALAEQHRSVEWFVILGADSIKDLPTWHEPRRILAKATVLAAARPGHHTWSARELAAALAMDASDVRMGMVDVPLIEISSRDLRQRAAAGRSLLFQLPRAVEVYIREKRLYRADS